MTSQVMSHTRLPPALALLLVLAGQGCAVHYANRRAGVEHLWGLGQLRLRSEALQGGKQRVAFGSAIPGLTIGAGRDHIGIALGFVERQELYVMDPRSDVQPGIAKDTLCLVLRESRDGVWGFGHLKMTSIPIRDGCHGIITAKAAAGLSAQVGRDPRLTIGTDTHQRLTILNENTYLSFAATNRHWPYFDLFNLQITSPTVTNSPTDRKDFTP